MNYFSKEGKNYKAHQSGWLAKLAVPAVPALLPGQLFATYHRSTLHTNSHQYSHSHTHAPEKSQ